MDWLNWELLKWPGWTLAVLLVVVGLAGTVLPALPGTALILAGLVLIAWMEGFQAVGPWTLVWLAILSVLSFVLDFLATAEGARRFGAGRHAILGATLGLVVGMFFGLPGLLVGPFIGAVLGHMLAKSNMEDSMRAGVGASIGVIVAAVANLGIGVIMIAWFVVAWFYS